MSIWNGCFFNLPSLCSRLLLNLYALALALSKAEEQELQPRTTQTSRTYCSYWFALFFDMRLSCECDFFWLHKSILEDIIIYRKILLFLKKWEFIMQLLKNEKVIDIMEKTLNHVDSRLIDHGKRVAYLIYKILEPQRTFNDKQLRDICVLAMLHDVGAYKTEEIDKMVIFETIDVWEHSIYGYLFLKFFSPLKEFSPIILFHHAECDEIHYLDPSHQLLAQLISLCDRADVFVQHKGTSEDFKAHIQKYRDIKYRSDIADMFLASGIDIDSVYEEIDTDEAFYQVFRHTPLTEDEANSYIKMIVFSIDFRSSQTVIHTIAATCIAGILASFLGADENEIKKIKAGTMLHDLGKVGIPLHILESTEGLTDADMEVMRTHVDITEKILDGNVDEDIKHMATRHHEKLNGAGYPKCLDNNDIALYDRIVTIADIFSALCGARSYKNAFEKEKVIRVLTDMTGALDPEIVSLTIRHFDHILEEVNKESLPVIKDYTDMNEEYQFLRKGVESKDWVSLCSAAYRPGNRSELAIAMPH